MKKVLAVILAVLMLFALVSCSEKAAPASSAGSSAAPESKAESGSSEAAPSGEAEKKAPIEITYTTWSQEDQYTEVVRMFNESQDDIHVTFEVIPTAELTPLLAASLGTPDAPDIVWGSVSTGSYVGGGLIEPLDDFVARDNFDLSVFYPACLAQQYYNGKLYGLPKGIDSYVMCYNTALFDKYGVEYPKSGWSWTDVDTTARALQAKINEAGGSEFGVAMMINEITHWFIPMCMSNGAIFITEDMTECKFNAQCAVDMVEMAVKLIQDGCQPDYATLTETNAVNLYCANLACMITLPSYASALTVVENSEVADTTKLIEWPKGPATGSNHIPNVTPNNFVMNSGSLNKDAAWEFMKFLTSEEADAVASAMQAHLPARISSFDEWETGFTKLDASMYRGQVEGLSTINMPVNYLTCLLQISPNMLPVYNGEISAKEGLDALAAAITGVLAENN